MPEQQPPQKVVELPMTPGRAQAIVNLIATETCRVIFGDHARQQMLARGFDSVDVYRILQKGYVDEDPSKTEFGEWKCKMVLRIKGSREAGVVTIIQTGGMLFIKTVEWEDMS
jgi:hypothetical protein